MAQVKEVNEGSTQARRREGDTRRRHRIPQAKCPIRYGEPCTACQPGTSGPEDCQLVQLVRSDPELMERMRVMNREHREAERAQRAAAATA